MEQTFVMIKPDGVQRALISAIIGAIEDKGYKLVAMKLLHITPQQAAEHYIEHLEKPFYAELVAYITSGPVVAMVWEGAGVVKAIRSLIGATDPREALPGTIRGRYAFDVSRNVVHGSDSPSSAMREIGLYFSFEELLTYRRSLDSWSAL